ncbi:MAG: tetratricopeptide repeat protein, partial [Candidatus Eisenbacteria bacterium]
PRVVLPVLFGVLLVFNVERALVQLAGWRTDETMYRTMIRAQPKRPDGYLGLALVSIGARKDKTALQALKRAEAIDSTRYEIATYRAAIASRRADWPEVIRWSRNAIRRGATESDPWLFEINALQSMRLYPWSRALVETLMVRHKSDPDVAAAYGRQMLGEDLPARAIKPLEYAVGWNSQDASLHLLLGDAYARVSQPEKAVEEFRRATGLEPGNGDGWLRLATVYHSLGESGLRDGALRNAASLPGADTTRLRSIYVRMLREEFPAQR